MSRVEFAPSSVVLGAQARAALFLAIIRARLATRGDVEHARFRQRRLEAFVPLAIGYFCGRALFEVVGELITAIDDRECGCGVSAFREPDAHWSFAYLSCSLDVNSCFLCNVNGEVQRASFIVVLDCNTPCGFHFFDDCSCLFSAVGIEGGLGDHSPLHEDDLRVEPPVL